MPHNKLHSILWKTAAVVWAALIFHLSSRSYGPSFSSGLLGEILNYLHITLSPLDLERFNHLLRKLAHAGEYAVFAMLMYGSSAEPRPFAWRPCRALWCVLITAAYSLTDEFHQSFVPGRTPALADCGIDSLGSALGMLSYYLDNLVFKGSITVPASSSPGKTHILRRLFSKH